MKIVPKSISEKVLPNELYNFFRNQEDCNRFQNKVSSYLHRHYNLSLNENDIFLLADNILKKLPYISTNELYGVLSFLPTSEVEVFPLLNMFSKKKYADDMEISDINTLTIISKSVQALIE